MSGARSPTTHSDPCYAHTGPCATVGNPDDFLSPPPQAPGTELYVPPEVTP
jgi:hypothetical protein